MSKPPLWCVHVLGPDDVYAAPSWAEASEAAQWLQDTWQSTSRQYADFPEIKFVVELWPWDSQSHANSLPEWREIFPHGEKAGV